MGFAVLSWLYSMLAIVIFTAIFYLFLTTEGRITIRRYFKNPYAGTVVIAACVLTDLVLLFSVFFIHTDTFYSSYTYRLLTYLTFNQVEQSKLKAENVKTTFDGDTVISLYETPFANSADFFLLKTKLDDNDQAKIMIRPLTKEQADVVSPLITSETALSVQTQYFKKEDTSMVRFDDEYEPLELVARKTQLNVDNEDVMLVYRMKNYEDNYILISKTINKNDPTKITVKPMRKKTAAPILESLNADTLWY